MSVETGLFIPADDLPPHDKQTWSVEGFDNDTPNTFQSLVNGPAGHLSLPLHGVDMVVNYTGTSGMWGSEDTVGAPNRLATFLLFEMLDVPPNDVDEIVVLGDVFIVGQQDDKGYLTSLSEEAFAGLDRILKSLNIQPLTND